MEKNQELSVVFTKFSSLYTAYSKTEKIQQKIFHCLLNLRKILLSLAKKKYKNNIKIDTA